MKKELLIDGMGCNKCVGHVREALSDIKGLKIESVEIGKAVVETDVSDDVLTTAIDEVGYEVKQINNI